MKLDNRLQAAADMSEGENIVDIGTDHAYLPVWLLKNGKCYHAVASDLRSGPLAAAKSNAEIYKTSDKMDFVLSNGFDNIEGFFDTAFICGMGGMLISDILERGKGKFKKAVLQPMTKAEELRKYLWDNGYGIDDEKFVTDGGKPYVVIKTSMKNGEKEKYTYADTFLGKIRPDTEEYRLYRKKIQNQAKKRLLGGENENDLALSEQK